MKYVYILRGLGQPGQRYFGITSNLRQRLEYHNTGRCSHTSKFIPWEIVYTEKFENETAALRRERQIKGWTREKKEALIAGDKEALKKLAKGKKLVTDSPSMRPLRDLTQGSIRLTRRTNGLPCLR